MNGLPIRWRLSLWYTSLTMIVLIIFSYAIYVGLERRLAQNLDEELRSKAALAAASVTFGQGNAIRDVVYRNELSDEVLLRVFSFDGTILFDVDTGLTGDVPITTSEAARAQNGQTTFTTRDSDMGPIRMVTVPVRDYNTVTGEVDALYALQLAYSIDEFNEPLKFLVRSLFFIAPLAIAIAALTGYALAGRALRPVSDITALASQIDTDELGARLNLKLPNDEIGRLASTFDSMLERIDEGFQRQRQFTGDAAHELRTPLALMRSQIDLAISQADNLEEYREALIALDGDVSRMTSLVSTMLSLARADSGGMVPNLEPTELGELVQDVAEQLEPIAAENDLRISTATQPVVASVDADMIIQVLVNLIDNAIKNTPAGGVITVTSSLTREGTQPAARISVSDTGIGMAPEHLAHIFDRFYRVDVGRARSRGGSGLGLAICRAIASAHGGTLTATSVEGEGSTFMLTLPIREPAAT